MKNKAAEVLQDVFEEAANNEVVEGVLETVTKSKVFTPKRLLIAAGVAVAVAGTVLIVNKIRNRSEDEDEGTE